MIIKSIFKIKGTLVLAIMLLLMQVFLVIYARYIPERFFCWSPYDEHSYMEVSVVIKGEELTRSEIKKRYHYRAIGWEKRSINNVFHLIKRYEATYGVKDSANVSVKYAINRHQEQIWKLEKELEK